jgi:hypothetical protein
MSPAPAWLSVRTGDDTPQPDQKPVPTWEHLPALTRATGSNWQPLTHYDLPCCASSLLMAPCDSGFKSPSGHFS